MCRNCEDMTVHKFIVAILGGAALVAFGGIASADPTGSTPSDQSANTSTPAQTQPAPAVTTATPAASASTSEDLDRIVCKSGPPPTGSRLGSTRECHTQREWDLRQQEQQQELTRQQINRGITGGP